MKKKKDKKVKQDRYSTEQKGKSPEPMYPNQPEIKIKDELRPESRNKAQHLRTQDFKNNSASKGLKPNSTGISRLLTGKVLEKQSRVMADNNGLDLEPPELTVMDTSGVGLHKDLDYLAKADFMLDEGFNEKQTRKVDSKTDLRRRLFGGNGKNKIQAGTHLDKEYIKPGTQINDQTLYTGNVTIYDQPDTLLDQSDYDKRLKFEKLKRARLEAMCYWKQGDHKGFKKGAYIKDVQGQNAQILQVIDKDDLEMLEVYADRFPLLKIRKQIQRFAIFISMTCYKIISQQLFDNISILVICINCFVMIMDPGYDCGEVSAASETEHKFFCVAESVFTYLYIIEMVLKIFGLGFIFRKGSYLRDGWNILDFIIVMSSILEMFLAYFHQHSSHGNTNSLDKQPPSLDESTEQGASLQGLRVIRVARPLKTISSIKGLKVIIIAVLSALPLLKDTLMVLGFFFVVFGILGQQLFGGILKNRCLNIQTGAVHPDDIFCSQMFVGKGESSCPAGYVCSKTDENPNYGVTNFDNLTYSMLAIFQCITLEGWSEIQRDIQATFHQVMYIFFIPMVVFGAFFLLNLTLAVINSKFAEAHNLQQEKDKIELSAAKAASLIELNDEGANAALLNDEISLSQFINARIYAKKMIQFLRMRQEIKRIEAEKVLNVRIKVQQQNKLRRASVRMDVGHTLSKSKSAMLKQYDVDVEILDDKSSIAQMDKIGGVPPLTKSNSDIFKNIDRRALEDHSAAIEEEENDSDQSQEEKDKLEKEVRNFLFRSKVEMQRSEKKLKKDQEQPYSDQKPTILRNQNISPMTLDSEESGPKLMGNLSITKLNMNKETFQKMAEELDIDKIIKKEDQVVKVSAEGTEQESINSFEVGSMKSQVSFFKQQDPNQEPQVVDLANIPGIDIQNLKNDPESGLISSDSDFSIQEAQLEANKSQLSNRMMSNEKKTHDISKDVSKTFKRMLTSNHNREYNPNPLNLTAAEVELIQSTRYGQSSDPRMVHLGLDYQTQLSGPESKSTQNNGFEIEKKYKKRKQIVLHKQYKEEEYQQHLATVQNQFRSQDQDYRFEFKTPGKELRALEEFVNSKQPRNVFQDIDPLFKKVEIGHGTIYNSTSQNDVFHPRQVQKEKMQMMNENNFLQLKISRTNQEVDPDYQSKTYTRNIHEPYQIKKILMVQEDSSDLLTESSENEDDLAAEEQPFMTANRIGFRHQTKQLYTKEICKRSDIMITSTISMSLFPKDQRLIEQHMRVYMDQMQLIDFVDEKNAFKSMMKEHDYQVQKQREKDKEYRDNYAKSHIFSADFVSPSLQRFKYAVTELNRNKKQKVRQHKQEIHRERIRHKQLLQASRKRGTPTFDMTNINNLLDGTFHDEEDEELVRGSVVHDLNKAMRVKKEDFNNDSRMREFKEEIQEICDKTYHDHRLDMVDEVPFSLRKEFNIPRDLGNNQINFNQIRKYDAQKKKTRQIWSGQDVLPDQIDVQKSLTIIQQINNHRVWPTEVSGLYKRFKYIIRIHAKSEAYDNFFTLFVLLSTIAMCAEKYGDPPEKKKLLDEFDLIVTYIFIYEMLMKQFAIGINKYLADSMNWLDGFIVLTSVIELIPKWQEKITLQVEKRKAEDIDLLIQEEVNNSSQINFSSFRVLRTLRVLRMVRLLRALKSMQVILGVVVSSYKSFMYITILMVLFIFILSLLGLQLFKGKYDNDPLGIPDSNFESFGPSFFTMFQILTMENWQSVLFVTLRNQKDVIRDIYLPTILFIAWIFVGNFILLNLFLAILLDAFLEEEDEELDEVQIAVIKAKKRAKKLEKKRKKQANMIMMDVNFHRKKIEGSLVNLGEEKNNSMEELEDLDSDQIKNIYQDEGIIKKDESKKEEEKLFEGVECAYSFYIFSQDNMFRILCYRATKHRFWETIIFILIGLSSFKLVTDSYTINKDNDRINRISEVLDFSFNIAFLIEMLIKLVSIGFIMDHGSYLRDEWNTLDFFIVCSSLIDMSLTNFDVKFVKVMRILRALRPLRFITHNVAMRLLVNALIKSLGGIFNVLFVVLVVYLLFAILAGSFYRGKFFYCSIDPYILHFQPQCEIAGGQWLLYDHNFDTAWSGSITMFIVASLEGWPDIFVQAWHAEMKQKPDDKFAHGPTYEGNFALALGFFFVFIFIGSFFFLNFFTGVLFMKFNQAQEAENKGFTKQDLAWKDIQKMILQSSPDYETTNVPPQQWRKKLHNLVIDERFETFVMTCIILNMVQMMLYIDDIQNQNYYEAVLAVFNYVFSAVFFIEAVLKLMAFGASYFQSNWNQFDFAVVVSSIIDIFSSSPLLQGFDSEFINQLSKNAKLLRIARVARILRLAGKAKGLQAILQTIFFSLPALGNVAVLLSLIYFMLAIVANFLFNDIIDGEVLDSQGKNFSNFMNSLVLLFALSTGEDWNKVMFDCSRSQEDGCVKGVSCAQYPNVTFGFFIFMIIVCSYVMLNLFVLVIIQQFEKYYLSEDENILSKFQNDLASFKQVWKEQTLARYACQKIKEKQLMKFFRDLGELNTSLGFPEENFSEDEMKKALLKMGIKGDNGYIYFNELLYRCMRRKYGTMKINKQMQIYELKTQYSIYCLGLNAQRGTKSKKPAQEDLMNNLVKKDTGVNPFLTIMNFRISFKTWLKYARTELEIIERRNSGEENVQSKRDKHYEVEIDKETDYEVTSEEDTKVDLNTLSGRLIEQASASGSDSYRGMNRMKTMVQKKASFKKEKNSIDIMKKKLALKIKTRSEQLQKDQKLNKANQYMSTRNPLLSIEEGSSFGKPVEKMSQIQDGKNRRKSIAFMKQAKSQILPNTKKTSLSNFSSNKS